jgi:hypothetical protein
MAESMFRVEDQDLDDRYVMRNSYSDLNCNNIGTPGRIGFGVGICLTNDLPAGMVPMEGCYDPANENYGNYIDADGSQMVYIPKFYTKITGTTVEISNAPLAGYALERAFIDGQNVWGTGSPQNNDRYTKDYADANGITYNIRKGIFVDKCHCSGAMANWKAVIGATVATAAILRPDYLAYDHNDLFQRAALCGRNGCNNSLVTARTIYGTSAEVSVAHSMPIWVRGALVRLAMCHSQASPRDAAVNRAVCAWNISPYSPAGNFGNCTDSTRTWTPAAGVASLTFTPDGGGLGASKAGSCVQGTDFTAHNGQKCGVLDMCGNYFEHVAGCYVFNTTTSHFAVEHLHNSHKMVEPTRFGAGLHGGAFETDHSYWYVLSTVPGGATWATPSGYIGGFPTFTTDRNTAEYLLWTSPFMSRSATPVAAFGNDRWFIPANGGYYMDGAVACGGTFRTWSGLSSPADYGMHTMCNWRGDSANVSPWGYPLASVGYELAGRAVRFPNGVAAQ